MIGNFFLASPKDQTVSDPSGIGFKYIDKFIGGGPRLCHENLYILLMQDFLKDAIARANENSKLLAEMITVDKEGVVKGITESEASLIQRLKDSISNYPFCFLKMLGEEFEVVDDNVRVHSSANVFDPIPGHNNMQGNNSIVTFRSFFEGLVLGTLVDYLRSMPNTFKLRGSKSSAWLNAFAKKEYNLILAEFYCLNDADSTCPNYNVADDNHSVIPVYISELHYDADDESLDEESETNDYLEEREPISESWSVNNNVSEDGSLEVDSTRAGEVSFHEHHQFSDSEDYYDESPSNQGNINEQENIEEAGPAARQHEPEDVSNPGALQSQYRFDFIWEGRVRRGMRNSLSTGDLLLILFQLDQRLSSLVDRGYLSRYDMLRFGSSRKLQMAKYFYFKLHGLIDNDQFVNCLRSYFYRERYHRYGRPAYTDL
jgi:hypothetical protein